MFVPPVSPVFSIDKEGEGKGMHRQKLVIRCQMRRWTTSLPMPSTYFELVKCPMADPVTYNDSMRTLEALERRLDGDAYVAARAQQLLAASPGSGPAPAAAAARLHLSRRTLIRRLRAAGATVPERLGTQ